MDYQPFLAAHRRKRADVTIAVRRVPIAEASRMGVLALDDQDRVVEWQEKPKQPKSDLASMGVYVFSKRALSRWLSDDRKDFGRDVIPAMLDGGARVFGYRFDGYWQDVGTIQSYWEANMALLDDVPELDLYDRDWLIHTRSEERAPAKIGPTAQVHRSLISHGCVINGMVVNSVLSPGVRVDVGAVIRDSIVMFDTVIRSGAVVDRAILDKEVVIGQTAIVGDGPDYDTPNRQEPGRLNTGHHRGRQAVGRAARRPPRTQREGRREGEVGGLRDPRGPLGRDDRSSTRRREVARRAPRPTARERASSRACRTSRGGLAPDSSLRRIPADGPIGGPRVDSRACPSPPERRRQPPPASRPGSPSLVSSPWSGPTARASRRGISSSTAAAGRRFGSRSSSTRRSR